MINTLLILTIMACGGGCRNRHDDDTTRGIADTSTSVGTSTAR